VKLKKKKIEVLAESIEVCGFCRPVIVNRRNNIIIAGHQRTKASRLLGRKEVPVYFTHASERGEMVINQIHNALEDNTGDSLVRVPTCGDAGFRNVSFRDIAYSGKLTNFANSFGVQLLRFGNIDAGVATSDGVVIKNVDYVIACRALCCPARIYYLPESADVDEVKKYLYGEYGKFSYAGKQKHSYQQTFAQPTQRRTHRSQTYLYIEKKISDFREKRILDFGAGEAVEATLLKKKGVNITSLEFFPRLRTSRNDRIDSFSCNYDVERLIAFLKEGGLFDLVICDSVLNSVISTQVEHDVLTCLNAFCKIGGEVVLSTRNDGELKSKVKRWSAKTGQGNKLYFNPIF
jgi:ParB family chromosome partitioning protein